ncbi:MAG TPA: acetylglucosamine-6-sulfatase, partial [Planctomycetaceae bacterium]|nr:acetylglucosamine-6-sulfatase [Planctomycetaceae bacterium]
DLKQDPDELVNLAGHPKYQDTLKEMRERTTTRVKELGGPLDPLKGKFTDSTEPHPVASAAVGAKVDPEGFVSVFD